MDPARLQAIPLFSDLDEETLRAVATFAAEKSVPAGEELVKEGDYAHEFMAIEEGEAEVLRGGERIATLGPGDFFGEIAVLEKTLRTATVVATKPMRLVTLTHWDLKRVGGAIEKIRQTLEERKRENA
jgi:CRP-like cAMP-binding protein